MNDQPFEIHYVAAWTGEAEFSDRQVRKALTALGWYRPWYRRLWQRILGWFA